MALFYRDRDEFLTATTAFMVAGLELGERVLVAVPGAKIGSMRGALNGGRARVEFWDMNELGRNPGRIIPAVRDWVDRGGGRRCRFIGEPIWPGRSNTEIVEATRHEALINLAFADSPATVLCPYDTAGLEHGVVLDAERTHPQLLSVGHSCPSGRYTNPLELWRAEDWPIPDPLRATATHSISLSRLGEIRAVTERECRHARVDEERVADVVLAVDEAATNALTHGSPPARLRFWQDAGEVICEIADGGSISDPLAGRRRPGPDWPDGRGLWMMNQLCDLVELRPTTSGTVVRLHVSVAGGAPGSGTAAYSSTAG